MNREENLRNTLIMMNNRFNSLAHWDNPHNDRYAVELDIISVEMNIAQDSASFPVIEILQTHIVDKKSGERHAGIVGNNFSSYVRDYDFSVLLLEHNKDQSRFSVPENFGELHGNIFKDFVQSSAWRANFSKAPVICLSVSSKDVYHRTGNEHPVLGIEYAQEGVSLTERYFSKWVCRYAILCQKQRRAVGLLFYRRSAQRLHQPGTDRHHQHDGDVSENISPGDLQCQLPGGQYYQPNLSHLDHSLTKIVYDREERSLLAIEQGKFTQQHFINPHKTLLEQWSANFALC